MTDTTFEYQTVEGGVPIKMWTRGVPVDDKAREQLSRTAKMPFIFKHVAVMPDVHVGIGATVGSVIPTKGAVIPVPRSMAFDKLEDGEMRQVHDDMVAFMRSEHAGRALWKHLEPAARMEMVESIFRGFGE